MKSEGGQERGPELFLKLKLRLPIFWPDATLDPARHTRRARALQHRIKLEPGIREVAMGIDPIPGPIVGHHGPNPSISCYPVPVETSILLATLNARYQHASFGLR